MGGSSRRQRSTSATRRRRTRHIDDSSDETSPLSPVLIWLLATSSLIVVISPTSPTDSIVLDTLPISKMYASNNNHPNYGDEEVAVPDKQHFFPHFSRPMGIRWRDDSRMFSTPHVMPILTEHRSASPFGRGASTSARAAASSSRYDYDSPTLEDIDLIDVLWRSDIAGEKGTRQVAPADQYECDLQTLTEKSTVAPLTAEENARYEDLSKGYYQDFYPSFNNNNHYHGQKQQQQQQQQIKSSAHLLDEQPSRLHNEQVEQTGLPTDKDLAELLEDVSREEGQLNLLFDDKHPIINNVSLSEGIVYTQANLTEMREIHDSCNQLSISTSPTSSSPSSQPTTLFNSTDPQTVQQWLQPTEVTPNDVFPPTNYVYVGMQNESAPTPVVSNGAVEYDHAYHAQPPLSPLIIGGQSATGRQQHTQTSPNGGGSTSMFDPYHSQRHSFSDCTTDSASTCSRLSSESPRYNSESSSSTSGPIQSRFYGKLVPARGSRYERPSSPRSSSSSSSSSTKIGRVVPLAGGAGQRKRGRQSKDEQLASENALPVSALQISEMSLSELQQVLKNENLSEYQRQLIRKIRRRGKNKVAARTCRQRRTDRHDTAINMNHYM